jgi:hypothetical protein
MPWKAVTVGACGFRGDGFGRLRRAQDHSRQHLRLEVEGVEGDCPGEAAQQDGDEEKIEYAADHELRSRMFYSAACGVDCRISSAFFSMRTWTAAVSTALP